MSIDQLTYAVNTMYHKLYLAPKPDGIIWTWSDQIKLLEAADTAYGELQNLGNKVAQQTGKRVESKFRRAAWRFLDDFAYAC